MDLKMVVTQNMKEIAELRQEIARLNEKVKELDCRTVGNIVVGGRIDNSFLPINEKFAESLEKTLDTDFR